jgi:hypothetical protein
MLLLLLALVKIVHFQVYAIGLALLPLLQELLEVTHAQ